MDSHLNTLPPTWPLVPLGSICEVGAGNGAPQGDMYFAEGTHPFVRMQDVARCQTPYITTTADRLNDMALEKHALREWPVGSLLIPKSGASVALNKRALLREPAYVVSHLAVLVPRGFIAPEYLYHLSCTLDMKRFALDPAYPSLRTSDLARLRIPLPPLSEQQRIVEILQEAEEIRRLRVDTEAKTAELISAVFDDMFGDPVRNPRDWDVETLAVLINDTPKNGLYKPADLYGEGTQIIRIGDFTGGIIRSSRALQRVRITDDEIEQFRVANGQILINRVNSIEHLGKSLLVASLTEPTVYESNMMRLDPNREKALPEFLIGCLQHASVVARLRAKGKKAINQASINQTDVLALQIPVPPIALQEAFGAQVANIEQLRVFGEQSLRAERALSAALSAHAFSGQLTADWREIHKDRLSIEALERDTALKAAGAAFARSRRATIQEMERISEQRTDGIYSDLNREQRDLLLRIQRKVGGVPYARYFSAQSLSASFEGQLRWNPQVIEGHLAVFAARGLVISVSREEQTEDTGEFVFGNTYRLPPRDHKTREGEEGEPRIGDYAKLREMERLTAQLEKELALK